MTDLRTKLLDAMQGIHERPIDYPQWGITGIILREFTARERQSANEAVTLDNPDDPDQVLFRAMLIQRCVTDPATGAPYADGRRDLATGQPAIDPRTRAPVFTVDDVKELADGRAALFNTLWDDLLEVAAMTGAATFSRDHAADSGERDQGTVFQGAIETPDGDADQGTGDVGERATHADGTGETDGQGDGAA
jgi:hypothetical protein